MLKLQYFDHLMLIVDSQEKTLMLGKTEGKRRKGWKRMRWLDSITDSMDRDWGNSMRQWRTRKPGMLQSMGSQRVGHNLSDWTTTKIGLAKRFTQDIMEKKLNESLGQPNTAPNTHFNKYKRQNWLPYKALLISTECLQFYSFKCLWCSFHFFLCLKPFFFNLLMMCFIKNSIIELQQQRLWNAILHLWSGHKVV